MASTMADVHVKVDRDIKMESEAVLKKIGISLSDLVNMTLRRVVYEHRIPFDTKITHNTLPENMSIANREELINYLKKGLDNDDGTRYSTEEFQNHLSEKRKEYEKIQD